MCLREADEIRSLTNFVKCTLRDLRECCGLDVSRGHHALFSSICTGMERGTFMSHRISNPNVSSKINDLSLTAMDCFPLLFHQTWSSLRDSRFCTLDMQRLSADEQNRRDGRKTCLYWLDTRNWALSAGKATRRVPKHRISNPLVSRKPGAALPKYLSVREIDRSLNAITVLV